MPDIDFNIPPFVWAAIAFLIIGLLILRGIAKLYQKVGPNQVLIVFGRGMRLVRAGGTIVVPFFETTKLFSLEQMKLPIKEAGIPSKEKIKVNVEAIAIVKVKGEDANIKTAAEQFLSKTLAEIMDSATQVLQAHMRGIVATMDVVSLIGDRATFQAEVATQSSKEMLAMGLEIVAFNVSNITDDEGYIEALGQPALAEVKNAAAVAQAAATQATRVAEAAADQAGKQAELDRDLAVAQRDKEVKVQRAEFNRETAQAEATAEKAHDLRDAELQKQLNELRGAAAIEQQKQDALVAAEKVIVTTNNAKAEKVVPAEAERQAAIATAEGKKQQTVLEAEGDAEATKARASAQAEQTRVNGQAEGEKLKAIGMGEADATRATLTAQAEGEKDLSDARSANDAVNLQELAIRLWFSTALESNKAFADAIGELGSKINFTQIGNGSGSNGHNGNMLSDFLMKTPELAAMLNAQTQALGGMSLQETVERVVALVKSGTFQKPIVEGETKSQEEKPVVAAGTTPKSQD